MRAQVYLRIAENVDEGDTRPPRLQNGPESGLLWYG